MYRNIIISDLKKSRLISATTFLFIAAATMLFSLAVMLSVNLTGAIDVFMTDAKTPHFMQMHSGEVDFERLNTFSESNNAIQEFQVMEFVNIEARDITVERQSFDGGVQDNGIVKQGNKFDFLLNLEGKVIKPKDGEIYVPLSYMKDGSIKEGDLLELYGQGLTVSGFLRDSQMNSLLSSSKRFLVSDSDFESIKPKGKMEYLIEFRLKDIDDLRTFEAQYIATGLESNGPTLTYPLFRMINGLSDGLMIAVILLMSFLVVIISFLCIRFILLARMEDDYREIGVLKAVGLHNRDIIKLYIAKYAVVSFAGCVFGYLVALMLKESLLEDIKLFMGTNHQIELEMTLGIISAFVIFVIVLAYVNYVLRRIRTVSVTETIRFGVVQDHSTINKRFLLSRSRVLGSNVFLAIKDVLGRKKLYLTMMIVLLISIFIMTLPLNLYSTVSSEHFISYMGVGKCDFRMDIQQTTDILKKVDAIEAETKLDDEIKKYVVLTTRSYEVLGENEREMRLKIETGDHAAFPIAYSQGRMPMESYDLALSAINAEEMGKGIGDKIVIITGEEAVELTICGIYSDITNGGKTAKASFRDFEENVMWSIVCFEVEDDSKLGSILSRYSDQFTYAKVSGIDEYVQMTFGSTIEAIKKVSIVGILVALFTAFLVILLFVKMLISKDRYAIAIMKSIGHYNKDIGFQFLMRTLLVSIVSICLGIYLSITMGERIAGLMISSFGATSFSFEINGMFTYVICPVLMLMVVYTATVISTRSIKDINIAQSIKE